MRELTWALFPGEELFAAAAAETLRSDILDDVYMIVSRCLDEFVCVLHYVT